MFDSKKPRILVALGGKSPEREASILSGQQVALALEQKGYPTAILDVGTGKLHQIPELESLERDAKKITQVPSFPLADIKRHFSLVFIALQGKFGEDGGFQSLMEEIDMPYTGSRPLACALSLDKKFAKIIMKENSLPTAEYQIVKSPDDKLILEFPVVVKPVNQGSSVGVAVCENEADYKFAVKAAFEFGSDVLVETYLGQTEISVCILEEKNGRPLALPVAQIKTQTKFFDYKSKQSDLAQIKTPADISDKLRKTAQEIAVKTHETLTCRHLSQVDMIIDQKNEIQILELDAVPNLTSKSIFAQAASAAKFTFEDLVEHLVQLALK